jgi:hypothetical protein
MNERSARSSAWLPRLQMHQSSRTGTPVRYVASGSATLTALVVFSCATATFIRAHGHVYGHDLVRLSRD